VRSAMPAHPHDPARNSNGQCDFCHISVIIAIYLVPALTHTAAPTVDLPHGVVRPDLVLACKVHGGVGHITQLPIYVSHDPGLSVATTTPVDDAKTT